jgi:SWI/SNF-related matrix-associated actin-dependent regulator 1 of chromatin subfamily A
MCVRCRMLALAHRAQAYLEVDRVFAQCTDVSKQLSSIMRIWGGQVALKKEAGVNGIVIDDSRAGSPDIDTGVSLIELDQTALDGSTQPWATEDVKEAFASYLREKPSTMSDNITLKGYQMLGLNWLNLLYSKGLSCILADEMGLGKTAQVIAFLSHLKTKEIGPHLVIVPSSTLDNWLREFDVFAPSLKVYSYYGTQGVRYDLRQDLKAAKDIDVIVTTYNMATGSPDDRKFLRKMEFRTCTYDEGHQLKNSESKKYKDLMEIKVPWRLLLTGTPLQNNLTELIVSASLCLSI